MNTPILHERHGKRARGTSRVVPAWRRFLMVAAMILAVPTLFSTGVASASDDAIQAHTCASGMNTATTGWATCWGGPVTFRLILNCYFHPQVVTAWHYQASGSHTIYASCPSWSHITGTFYQTQG